MYPIPIGENLVETKVCKQCKASFPITDKDLEFYDKVSPVFFGKKYAIPTPTLCPDCRQMRRLAFRNERRLYKRNCDATGKTMISIYSPDKPFPVYHQDYWWSDNWDPMTYAIDFDFSRSFFDQFGRLSLCVPRRGIINDNGVGSQNCEYTCDFLAGKNCYMCFEMGECEDSMYSHHSNGAKNCIDCDESPGARECYEVVNGVNAFSCTHTFGCLECRDCHCSVGLVNCSNCIMCHGLENASYCYRNEKITKEEFTLLLQKLPLQADTLAEYVRLIKNHSDDMIRSSEDCSGYNIMYSKGLRSCHNSAYSENVRYGLSLYEVKNCYDIQCWKSELCYEGQTLDESFMSAFCAWSSVSRELYYSDNCHSCKNCFGCIGLRNKQYCVLNKQYTKEQYEELVPKIIEKMMADGEWGEFFPASLSPFGYNETVANEYFPLTRNQILSSSGAIAKDPGNTSNSSSLDSSLRSEGRVNSSTSLHGPIFNWSDYEAPFPKVEKIIPASKLPDDITKIPDDILNWAIECEVTGKPFRIIKQELEFYRKHNLSIPLKHPDQRYKDRIGLRNIA